MPISCSSKMENIPIVISTLGIAANSSVSLVVVQSEWLISEEVILNVFVSSSYTPVNVNST